MTSGCTADAEAIERLLPSRLRDLHRTVVHRARAVDANALILSGSTVRARRTEISDLDYHVVGNKVMTTDLSPELDVHVLSAAKLESDLLSGDDFIQWSLRFGLVVFDDGVVEQARKFITEEAIWPDPARKREHATKSLDLARRFVATGDQDGATVQVRTALSLAARAFLLKERVFPLSRAELPDQLRSIDRGEAADYLALTIYHEPSLSELVNAVDAGEALLAP